MTSALLDDLYEQYHAMDPIDRMRDRCYVRVGKDAHEEIIQAAAPPSYDDIEWADDLLKAERRVRRQEWIDNARSKWGQEGNLLLGLPVICDPDFEGVRVEVPKSTVKDG